MAPQAGGPVIRAYRDADHADLYDICVRTAAAGQDARGVYSTDDLMPDVYAGPYVELEPNLAFVLTDPGRAVGYVVGTADTAGFAKAYRNIWLGQLVGRYPRPWSSADGWLLSDLYRPERMVVPELAAYPAHLHIDVLPGYQGSGWGRALIETFFTAASAAGAGGVHVSVDPRNIRASGFYARLGFHEIDAGPDTVIYLGRAI